MVAAASLIPGLRDQSYAFHDGGVGVCEGCHTMHNSQNGFAVTTAGGATQFSGRPYLLKGSDASSICLNCHLGPSSDSTVMSTASGPTGLPSQMTPGGDFAWLNISTTYVTSGGVSGNNPGTRHGHNIVAADYNLFPSTVYTTAPGGSYPAASLSCVSCHDPHGKYRVNSQYQIAAPSVGLNVGPITGSGSDGKQQPTATASVGVYRLLGGIGYLPASVAKTPALAFTSPPPFAFAPSTYNRSEAVTDTRVAYGSGMSEWCENCHALSLIHTSSTSPANAHPAGDNFNAALSNVDAEGITIATRYNNYISSGNLSGIPATSYTSMVPYEEGLMMGAVSYADLATRAVNDGSQRGGPTYYATGGNEVVMCLSCHRAHASAWPSILRWNAAYGQYLTIQGEYPGIDAPTTEGQGGEYTLGYLQVQVQRSFYDRPASTYAAYQKSLCKKCHNTAADS